MTTLTRENKLTAPTRNSHVAWTATNPVVPEGVLIIVKDRLYVGSVEYAIGDGVSNYNALRKFGEAKDAAGKIDLANVVTNSAEGLLKLDANGKAPAERLYITGALAEGNIIESAENANGWYTKFADGTLICHSIKYLVGIDTQPTEMVYSSNSWITPHNFMGNYIKKICCCKALDANSNLIYLDIATGMDCDVAWNTGASSSVMYPGAAVRTGATAHVNSASIELLAIGRWKALG